MQPLDPDKKPAVHATPLNHIGLWVDDLAARWSGSTAKGVRFAPGGIRKGAAGHDICFIHPKGERRVPARRRRRADRAGAGAARRHRGAGRLRHEADPMTIREILKMGDARLLRVAQPVRDFGTPELRALIADMFETMPAANGAGLAAPQIGVDLQLVIFGFEHNERYPDAPPVPETVLINPRITPLDDARKRAGKAACRCRACAAWCRASRASATRGFDAEGAPIEREAEGFHARVVQHECDHLIGRLYPMRMRDFSRFGFTSVLFPGLDADADD